MVALAAMVAVINAILACAVSGMYVASRVPGDFPAWSTVYGYFRQWQKDGTCRCFVHDLLYQWVRVAAGREPSPTDPNS